MQVTERTALLLLQRPYRALHFVVRLAAHDAPLLAQQAQDLAIRLDGPRLVAPDLADMGDAGGAVGELGGGLKLLPPAIPPDRLVVFLPQGVDIAQRDGPSPILVLQGLQLAEQLVRLIA